MWCKNFKCVSAIVLASTVLRCADTLLTTEGFAGKKSSACQQPAATTTGPDGAGVFTTAVDATCETNWTYYDFDSRSVRAVAAPLADTTWELGFQRFKIKLNGGVSGAGGATVLPLAGDQFAALSAAPVTFSPALADADDPVGDPNSACRPAGVHYAFLNTDAIPQGGSVAGACWFAYNLNGTHALDPTAITYVLRTSLPKYYKIKFDSYYSATGTAGMIRFRWQEL